MPVVEKIIEMPVTFFIPILQCGHAGEMTSLAGTLRIGDEQECIVCESVEQMREKEETT